MRGLNGLGRAVLLMAIGLLASCGGGGGGGGNGGGGGGGGGNNPVDPNGEPMGTIQGVAQDGRLNDAVVTVYAWNGTKGAVLTAGRTDFQGRYSVSLRAASQPVLIEVTGGEYVEEATFRAVSLSDGQSMLAVLNYRSGDTHAATVTYFSTLAAGLAERLSRDGAAAGDAVSHANQRIGALVGLDITQVEPTEIAAGRDLSATATQALEYGFATAALSSYTEFLSTSVGLTPHETINSIAFIQLAYDDIRADGQLNGRGTAGDLFLGTLRLNAEVYRHELALNVLRIADNSLVNQTQIRGPSLLPLARRLNDSTDGIFGSDPIVALGSDAPNIGLSLVDQAVIFGKTSVSVSAASVVGINRVDGRIVDGSQATVVGPVAAPDPRKAVIVLDTTMAPDGVYQLVVTATDTAGATATKALAVNVANRKAVIENVMLPTDRPVSKVQSVKATINDPVGVAKVEYIIDGFVTEVFPNQVSANPLTEFMLDTTKLADGNHTLTIKMTNQEDLRNQVCRVTDPRLTDPACGTLSRDVSFSTDNAAPMLANITPADGAFVNRITVDGTVTEQNPKQVQVFIDGMLQGSGAGLPLSVPRPSTEGPKKLLLRVTDAADNASEVTRQITFDATPPTMVSVTSPADGRVVVGGITVTGTAMDEVGLSQLRLGWVEVASGIQISCSEGDLSSPMGATTGRLSFFTRTDTERNGAHRFILYARDLAGNETASAPVVLQFMNSSAPETPPMGNGPDCSVVR